MASNAHYRRTSALVGGLAPLILLGMAAPAFAQAPTTSKGPCAPGATAEDCGAIKNTPDEAAIVVTGTSFKRRDLETPSPVTRLTTDDLQKRGIQTVQAAIQSISSNNGPALTNSFTANGAFAGGASAVSLRGLTTDSTLVLFDGLRAAYYPLADDGTRNFVDLNTIPDAIVDHIDVLDDGASSIYGADAVAGVVNIITKKSVVGFHGKVEAGVSQRKDYGNHRIEATYGYGDLNDQGFNAYVSGHFVNNDALSAKDRGYPYNTDNQTGICHTNADGTFCGTNNIANGATNGVFGGLSSFPDVFLARPYSADNSTPILDADGNDRYQLLNPTAGCTGGTTAYTLSPGDYGDNKTSPHTVCQQDITHDYGQIEPKERRWGVSGRFSAHVGGNATAYAELNYENSYTAYSGIASSIRANAPAGIDFPAYSTSTAGAYGNTVLALPYYICPRGTNVACTATNGTINPNNPFANGTYTGYAPGTVARIIGRVPTSDEFNSTLSQVYRGAAGIDGSFGDNWNYRVEGTGMVSRLTTTAKGYVYIQHLLDEVADGSYNFVNPQLNSADTLNYLTPTQVNHQVSKLYQGQATLAHEFFQLPGGPIQVSVGAAGRYESVNDPSGNPDYNGPTERYFRLNAFGATGSRKVYSGFFEIDAPILHSLDVNVSGRYDHYSTKQSNFSPKVGVKFTPIRELILRGTFSKGFRIPSFAESNALPTTGYVNTAIANLPDSYLNQHLAADGKNPDQYVTACSVNVCIGETTVGNPKLKPEKSQNITAGFVLKPLSNVNFTFGYYNIKKTNAITSVDFGSAIANYYATGETSLNGVTIIKDEVDPDHPTAQPRVGFAQGSFINANTIKTAGLDFGLDASYQLSDHIRYSTHGTATYILYLNTTFPDGSVQHYAGTLGNYNLTAGSGTQRWKATWENTIDFGRASITATAYYTSGYNYSAEDQGGSAGDCSLVPTGQDAQGNSGPYQACNVKSVIFVDLHGEIKVGDRFTFYGDILNVADKKPPIDATTYGAYLYNPVVGDEGIIGRSFRIGARVDL